MLKTILSFVGGAALLLGSWSQAALAQVNPGDLISKDQAGKVAELVSPGNLVLVKQGMQLKIVRFPMPKSPSGPSSGCSRPRWLTKT